MLLLPPNPFIKTEYLLLSSSLTYDSNKYNRLPVTAKKETRDQEISPKLNSTTKPLPVAYLKPIGRKYQKIIQPFFFFLTVHDLPLILNSDITSDFSLAESKK